MAECQMPERRQNGSRSRPARPPPLIQTADSVTDVKSFQKLHDNAYKAINRGLKLDEQGSVSEAVSSYQKGLQMISHGLNVDVGSFSCTEDEKNNAKLLQQKMTKTKLQIEYRLQSLTQPELSNGHQTMEVDCPPSYEEATSPSSISDEAFNLLGDSIMDLHSSIDPQTANAREIFCIPDGVQIFYISPEGYVSAPSYPSALKMCKFTEAASADDPHRPPAFMQVDDWFYPLVPGTSPALHASNGAYIFPDVTATTQGSAVGLLLPPDATASQRQQFEEMLSAMTDLHQETIPSAPPMEGVQDSRVPQDTRQAEKGGATASVSGKQEKTSTEEEIGTQESTSTKIAKGITIASEWISWGLEKGSEKAGHFIRVGSSKLKERLKPEEEAKEIDPKLQKGVQYARQGAHVAVTVSSYVVKKLGQATVAVAKEVAPHIRKQGEKLLPPSVKGAVSSSSTSSKLDGALEVAASGLKGFGTVYMSLEKAAKALGKNLANETVTIVDHKYGNQAAQLSENALYAVGNVAMTAYNVDNLGVKAIAKRAAKDTGKALITDVHNELKKTHQDKPKPPT